MNAIFSFVCVIHTEEIKEEYRTFIKEILDTGSAELLLYDTVCSDETQAFGTEMKTLHPDDVCYAARRDWNQWQCYNEAIAKCRGKYLNLSKNTVYFPAEDLEKVQELFEQNKSSVVSLEPVQVMNEKKTRCLKFFLPEVIQDLEENPYKTNMILESYFFTKEILSGILFDENVEYDTSEFSLYHILEKIKKYPVLRSICEIHEYTMYDRYNYCNLYDKDWYTKEIREVYLPFLKANSTSKLCQAWIVQLIVVKLNGNINDSNKAVLNPQERDEFFELLCEVFQYVDDDVLGRFHYPDKRILGRYMPLNFLRMKYHYQKFPVRIEYDKNKEGDQRYAVWNNIPIEYLDQAILKLKNINWNKNKLTIDGQLSNMYYADYDQVKLYVRIGKERIPAVRTQIYCHTKLFGKTVEKGYMFRAEIPEEKFSEKKTAFTFEIEYLGEVISPNSTGARFQTRLSNMAWENYWRFGDYILQFIPSRKEYRIERATIIQSVKRELRYQSYLRKCMKREGISEEEKKRLRDAITLRRLYFLTKPFYGKKNIWISFDQLFKGGDNGEYFYRYMRENHKEIPTYYVVNKDTAEYRELKSKYDNVLAFGSRKAQLLALHAKMIFDTRAGVRQYFGFTPHSEKYFKDLFNADVVCLQHGLTIQKIAQYQNRVYDNIKHYFCVSPYEVENIRQPIYGYTDDMISLTGAPRYDGLTGVPKKQILITPTWRRNVTEGTNKKGSNHLYSVNFRNTVYFKIYNSLINDERLIQCAKETGYKLIYLIHPILSPQSDDFDKNEYVEICPGVGVNYEKILKESSLMVTDYSGIQFDFAYMRRPLIYYHPDELPPQYAEGNLKYDTMGFGPVCRTNDEIVNELCKYMRNQCRLEEMYRDRIERFFPYNDQKNCERVYEAAVKFQQNR